MTFSPATHRIIFPIADGVAVSVVAPDCPLPFDEIITQTVPDNTPYRIINTADLPADRHFRDAWSFVDDEEEAPITMSMSKARDVHRQNIRSARSPLMADLDAEFMQALESNSSTTAIAATKQALRDAPADPAIDAATTVSDLMSQWDTELLGASPYLS